MTTLEKFAEKMIIERVENEKKRTDAPFEDFLLCVDNIISIRYVPKQFRRPFTRNIPSNPFTDDMMTWGSYIEFSYFVGSYEGPYTFYDFLVYTSHKDTVSKELFNKVIAFIEDATCMPIAEFTDGSFGYIL